ncbi:hypothetical protein SUGI_0823960 [Cryptomeria japonica]|uniref:subtilisin-like protease SBT2.2 n=1 Tax=Cryptomeria japonica TaxID=3369 RepID=UPI0024146EA8|nr:subtilisin-like protease SBT2.2 [Cryptomeria japonica]GLJ40174.1 hypothetical protein SUGI_0823960 [Cryptomeria japonica]
MEDAEASSSKKCYCYWASLVIIWVFCCCCCFTDAALPGGEIVYIVMLRDSSLVHLKNASLITSLDRHNLKTGNLHKLHKSRHQRTGMNDYTSYLVRLQDSLLKRTFQRGTYKKLYSYHYLINGFSVLITPQQAETLATRPEVSRVIRDFPVHLSTTHTPDFLGLPKGAWVQYGGPEGAGEGIVIGFIDTGIDPKHPSFSDTGTKVYPIPAHFTGACEVTRDFPSGSCNRKLIGARHFAAAAIARGVFNASEDYASPYDGIGHGTHIASIAAGNYGISVIVSGHHFGNASGMAPRAHIAIYKALYSGFGGFAADVVAAIDQAAQDGVDILSLSITPGRPPPGIATFFNPIDMALLSAVKAGIFVVQAAGNTGPTPKSILSFSPWIFTVGAATHDRSYNNSIVLGNNLTISGVGLAPGTDDDDMFNLVAAVHAQKNGTDDMYANECQDPNILEEEIVEGNLLICSYTIRFVLGLSSVRRAVMTAKNLSAAGIVFYTDPFVVGFQMNPVPMMIPGVIIQSADNSKIFLKYYNDSIVRNESDRVLKFGGVARILGGMKANYSKTGPKLVYYSSRGPNLNNNLMDAADVLKPNIIAPGHLIWGAWSSVGTDSAEFEGENFAMLSGTSMAAPHIAGVAALVKQKYSNFNPAAIGSALSTTASVYDKQGSPIMAQHSFSNPDADLTPATPFDMGSGSVNPTAALDPGLIFNAGFDDYVAFLCSINGSAPLVLNYTGCVCKSDTGMGSDLNIPSITVGTLINSRTIQRSLTNIAASENYKVLWSPPWGVSVTITPFSFRADKGETKKLTIVLNATTNSTNPSFGRILLVGNNGHNLVIPLSVITKITQNSYT